MTTTFRLTHRDNLRCHDGANIRDIEGVLHTALDRPMRQGLGAALPVRRQQIQKILEKIQLMSSHARHDENGDGGAGMGKQKGDGWREVGV